jgi:hypothetical protein
MFLDQKCERSFLCLTFFVQPMEKVYLSSYDNNQYTRLWQRCLSETADQFEFFACIDKPEQQRKPEPDKDCAWQSELLQSRACIQVRGISGEKATVFFTLIWRSGTTCSMNILCKTLGRSRPMGCKLNVRWPD